MSTTTTNPDAKEEIRLGVANACLMMPQTSEGRAEELHRLHHLQDEEKEAVAEAKANVGVADHVKRLHKVFGVSKATIQIMKILDKVGKPGDRAAVLTQVGLLSKDVGYCDKDLVSLAQEAEATAGQQGDDQGSVFDKTSEGERRGGKDAQPKHVEPKEAAPAPAPTPGIDLTEALAKYEEAAKGWSGKGRKPKALVQAAAELEAAEKANEEHKAAEAKAVGPEVKPDDFDAANDPGAPPPAPRAAAAELDDDLPPPSPRKAAPLPGSTGQGSYRLN